MGHYKSRKCTTRALSKIKIPQILMYLTFILNFHFPDNHRKINSNQSGIKTSKNFLFWLQNIQGGENETIKFFLGLLFVHPTVLNKQ